MVCKLKNVLTPTPPINNDRSLISTMKRPCFTKIAVSPLILVRFSKFKVWHTQHSDPDLLDARDVTRARASLRTSQPQSESGCCTVAMGPYLLNREVDFASFLHANWYGEVGSTMKNSALCDQYRSHERISLFPWQPIGILKFRFQEVFSVTIPDLPAKFSARRSINGRGVSGQTESMTLLKL